MILIFAEGKVCLFTKVSEDASDMRIYSIAENYLFCFVGNVILHTAQDRNLCELCSPFVCKRNLLGRLILNVLILKLNSEHFLF
jgi:hypothetical protein